MTINIVEAVLLCFLVAALVRMPAESGPRGATTMMYFLVVVVLTYVLVTGVAHR